MSGNASHAHRWVASSAVGGLAVAVIAPFVAGCTGPQSTLDPAGPAADSIATIWWLMFFGSAAIFVGVLGLLAFALMRRGRGPELRHPFRFILAGGLVLPTFMLAALLVYGVAASGRITGIGERVDRVVEVTGHRWFWEFRYLDDDGDVIATSRDRLAMPRGAMVEFKVTSADVIHSFWIPRLGGKIDAIPGRINTIRLRADGDGAIRGQCAEFCGRDHAHMVFSVDIVDTEAYAEWLTQHPPAGDDSRPIDDVALPDEGPDA
jgi:cytochrome c oxidase subunit 2